MTRSMILKALLFLAVSLSLLSAQTANPKQPKLKGPKEQEAVMAVFQAPDPDARIAAANNLVTKFAESDFKARALFIAADAYQSKGDVENSIAYAEKCLESDPQFFGAMLLIARNLALRTREFDLDREEKLTRSEKLAKESLALVGNAPKPNPSITDEQWEGYKKEFAAQAHEALAMGASVRKNYDGCVAELKIAVESVTQPEPTSVLRLADCQGKAKKFDEALANLDKVLADANATPQIKKIATDMKISLNKAKTDGK